MKKLNIKQIIIPLTSSLLLGCAASGTGDRGAPDDGEPMGSDCIFESTIRDYRVLDQSNLVVTASRKQKYHIRLSRPAFGLDSSWSIGFSTRTSQICAGSSSVVFRGTFEPEAIRISGIRAVNDAEYDNLLIRYGKKKPEEQETPPAKDIEGAEVEELD